MIPIGDCQKSNKFPIITYLLIAINIIVFLLELISPNFDQFISTYAFTPAHFSIFVISTWFPLFSAAFLHGGFSHIIFNMLFLWVFGDNVEESLGSFGYILFYFGAIISSALLQYAIDPQTTIPMLGASGAIAGVLGYYLIVFPKHKIKTLLIFAGGIFVRELPAQIFLAYWAVTQLFSGFGSLMSSQEGGTAWFAHIGGLLCGLLVGYFMQKNHKNPDQAYEIIN